MKLLYLAASFQLAVFSKPFCGVQHSGIQLILVKEISYVLVQSIKERTFNEPQFNIPCVLSETQKEIRIVQEGGVNKPSKMSAIFWLKLDWHLANVYCPCNPIVCKPRSTPCTFYGIDVHPCMCQVSA